MLLQVFFKEHKTRHAIRKRHTSPSRQVAMKSAILSAIVAVALSAPTLAVSVWGQCGVSYLLCQYITFH